MTARGMPAFRRWAAAAAAFPARSTGSAGGTSGHVKKENDVDVDVSAGVGSCTFAGLPRAAGGPLVTFGARSGN